MRGKSFNRKFKKLSKRSKKKNRRLAKYTVQRGGIRL